MITFLILRPDIISFWSDSLLKGPTLLNWEFKTSWIDLFPSSFNLNFLFKLTPDIFWQQNDFSQQTEFFKLIHFLEKFWLYLPLCIDNSTLQFDFRFRFTNETNERKFSYSTWYFRRWGFVTISCMFRFQPLFLYQNVFQNFLTKNFKLGLQILMIRLKLFVQRDLWYLISILAQKTRHKLVKNHTFLTNFQELQITRLSLFTFSISVTFK